MLPELLLNLRKGGLDLLSNNRLRKYALDRLRKFLDVRIADRVHYCIKIEVMVAFTTRHGKRNQVFCRLNQANRCFSSILEHQKCLSKRKTWFLVSNVG